MHPCCNSLVKFEVNLAQVVQVCLGQPLQNTACWQSSGLGRGREGFGGAGEIAGRTLGDRESG